ncbi:hypothetical protein [Conexibacter woesei]|uniref:hypothetical protein n=1 Tax=Conexibacter woesei TaxID=191495 RepID=UPI0003FA3AF7|nr:hypothetical protein [Conexibacter woesei]
MPSLVVDNLLHRNLPPLAAGVRFASPFADYAGAERVAPLLAVMPDVFDELAVVRELRGDDDEVAVLLRGRCGDETVDVMVDERHDDAGAVSDMMIMVRPLSGTKAVIARMGALMRDTDR